MQPIWTSCNRYAFTFSVDSVYSVYYCHRPITPKRLIVKIYLIIVILLTDNPRIIPNKYFIATGSINYLLIISMPLLLKILVFLSLEATAYLAIFAKLWWVFPQKYYFPLELIKSNGKTTSKKLFLLTLPHPFATVLSDYNIGSKSC